MLVTIQSRTELIGKNSLCIPPMPSVTSELLEGGVALTVVQRQLRHSDARITLGTYGHVVGNAQRRAVEAHKARVEKYAV
jgi:integrase